ncbi:lysophospholipid acyltransferase 2-like [Branchiostoma floridae]|uniref:Lysophospholipid acyltransferase 2-like n=1 Tax=Branchiostoma floridae TaxID=7739 RepID=A0A9J7N5U1_BRAFL|nr:lysophospholipid acyltransferase 2-like [Branchiostoma floridae]
MTKATRRLGVLALGKFKLGYIFSAPGLLAGPLYSYTEYGGLPQKSAPKTLVLYKILTAAAFFSVHDVTGHVFPLHKNGDLGFVESTLFLQRIVYLWISSFVARMNYYWLWSLSEGLCNAAGLGRDARGHWDAISDYSFLTLELSTNMIHFTRNWNKTTSAWLKRLVYYRFSHMRTALTFLVSALWHGPHPGIFIGFSAWAVVVSANRKVAKLDLHSRLPSARWRFLHTFMSWLTTQLAVGFILTTIHLQGVERILVFWSSMYYSLPLGALLCLLLPV